MDQHRIAGALLGAALGDALGLPYEGLSATRGRRLLGPADRFRFLPGCGMVSDDTEHSCLVLLALLESGGDPVRFGQQLAWGLRWWLLGLPAGIGWATLRAIVRLWLGFRVDRSGVRSAGNGPAMRCAVLGAAVPDRQRLIELVRQATFITHRDPRALVGALAVAFAAGQSAQNQCDGARLLEDLQQALPAPFGEQMMTALQGAVRSHQESQSVDTFLLENGHSAGVSGFVVDTVAVAIRIWLAHPADFEAAVTTAVHCGGDTDTLAAIVGGIVGARCGDSGLPQHWLRSLWEWPRSVQWMRGLAGRVADGGASSTPIRYGHGFSWLRNAVFLCVVIGHVLRRPLPPY